MHTLRSSLSILSLRSIVSTASSLVSTTTRSISSTATSALGASPCGSEYPPDVEFSDSCAACLDPCTDHPQLPARLAAKVNQGAMAGSVKPYSHHLILCTGSSPASWAARVDSASPLARALSQVAGELPAVAPAKVSRVLANVCDRAPLGGVQHFFDKDGNEVECMDVMVWPDRVLLTGVTADNVGAAVKEYFEHEKVESVEPSDMAQGLPRPAMEPLDVDRAVFVCAHKKRDSRCGEAAPLLLRAFHDEIDALEAKSVLAHGSTGIYGISHIGGHKFAGTMIVFRGLEGHWYGRVRVCDVETIVREHLVEGMPVKQLWRGMMRLPVAAAADEEQSSKVREKEATTNLEVQKDI